MKSVTFDTLIEQFIDGATDGCSGTEKKPGSLKIISDQLIHFNTPILERYNGKYILNLRRYSLQTSQVQNKVKARIPADQLIVVTKVPSNFSGSMAEYIPE